MSAKDPESLQGSARQEQSSYWVKQISVGQIRLADLQVQKRTTQIQR